MSPDRCPSPEVLAAFALGDIPEPSLSEVSAHLEGCPTCERRVARLDAATDPLLAALRRLGRCPPSLDPDDPTPATMPGAAEAWGDFRIVRELGRGGMGVVCEAYQGSLDRHVAIKFLPEAGDLARFRREARAAGRLHHTNIVPVFGVGEHRGRAYYVMQFIAGEGLDRILRRRPSGRLDDREAARIGVQVAEALAYAHDQGVIHRDIKPSNLLMDGRETVWVTDFGLAHDASDVQPLTQTGDFLGTLRYLAPERLSGRGDARGDLYALGATLYELTTGSPPYPETDRAVLVHRLLNQDPPRPRQLEPRIARDLETILLKAMAREPSHRYESAAAMADDLRRFLEDRSIRARRAGPIGRGVRWCRRNRALASMASALALALLGGLAGVTIQWRRAEAEARRAGRIAIAEAEARAAESELRVRAEAEVAGRDLDLGLDLAARGDVDRGLLRMAEALREAPAGRPELERMARTSLSAWEGQLPRRLAILEHGQGVPIVRFAPGGRAFAVGGTVAPARIYGAGAGEPIGRPLDHPGRSTDLAFSPDGRRLAVGTSAGIVRVYDAETGEPTGPALGPARGAGAWPCVARVSFSPDGRHLAAGSTDGRSSRVWDLGTGRALGLSEIAGAVASPAFSPDGGRLLVIDSASCSARVFSFPGGRAIGPPISIGARGGALSSPDGRRLFTYSQGGQIRAHDATTGRAIGPAVGRHPGIIGASASPDGRLVLTFGWDRSARLWEASTGRMIGPPLRHGAAVAAGSFSPDGRRILTAGHDQAARVWDAATGRPIGTPLRHRGWVSSAAFSPDGRRIATAAVDGTTQLWEYRDADLVPVRERSASADPHRGAGAERPEASFSRSAFAPDGSRAYLGGGRSGRVVDVDSGRPIGRPILSRWANVQAIAFAPDGLRVAIACRDVGHGDGGSTWSTCRILDATTGRPASPMLPHPDWPAALAFRPDGAAIASGDYTGTVRLWDAATGRPIGRPWRVGSIVQSLAFRPDGRRLAVGTADPANQLVLWDLDRARPVGDPIRFGDWVRLLAFSPDGFSLAAGSSDRTVRVIESATGRVLATIRLDSQPKALAFSDDGLRLMTAAAGSTDGVVRLWDARTGEPASPTIGDPRPGAGGAVLDPTGGLLATADQDGAVRLWNAADARPIGAGWSVRWPEPWLAFRDAGRSLTAIDRRGNVRTWPVPRPSGRPVEELMALVQDWTGLEFDAGRSARLLAPGEWRRLHAGLNAGPAADDPGDHDAGARDAEALGDPHAARWHLDRLIAARPGDGTLLARRAGPLLRAGEVDAALADLDRALAMGPVDPILDAMAHLADDARLEGRPADAATLLGRLIAARPGDWHAHALLAEALGDLGRPADREAEVDRALALGADVDYVLAIADARCRAGRWAEAAGLFDRAIAEGPVPVETWMQAATAHLHAGDMEGFRRVCAAMRGRHPGESADPFLNEILAHAIAIGPGGIGDDGKALAWIESLPDPSDPARPAPRSRLLRTAGAVLLRAGRLDEAIDRLEEAALATSDGPSDLAIPPLLAMAYFRGGDTARARAILAVPWPGPAEGPSAEAWWAARGLEILRAEAARMVLDPGFPDDPFAP